MNKIDEILNDYENYARKQFNELCVLEEDIRYNIIKFNNMITFKQSKHFLELLELFIDYKLLLSKDIIKFMLYIKILNSNTK